MVDLIQEYSHIFIQNKYLNYYQNLINRSLIRNKEDNVYYEKHHYVPKSILKNKNIVYLTAREHFIAHLLLSKCVNLNYRKKMIFAITAMKFTVLSKIKCNSILYSKFQKESNIQRAEYMRNRIISQETKDKIRKTLTGSKHTQETKDKMSLSRKQNPRKWTEKDRQRMLIVHTGKIVSEETRKKQSINRLNRIKITCEYCGNLSEIGNHTRWHGKKCKFKS